MDYLRIIEQDEYSVKHLSAEQRAFLAGMRHACESVENVVARDYNPDEGATVLDRLVADIVADFLPIALAEIEIDAAGLQISFIEEMEEGEPSED